MDYIEHKKNIYVSSRHEASSGLNLSIPWDSNAFKGLVGGVSITMLILLLIGFFEVDSSSSRTLYQKNYVPLELLSFGSGDGTGVKSGNLTEEGAKAKGQERQTELQDAEIAKKDISKSNTDQATNDDVSDRYVAVKETTTSKEVEDNQNPGNSNKSVGSSDGSDLGSGLKVRGSGSGAGDGFGDIDWGGGGNRVVLKKVLPKMPSGVQASAKVVLRFRVLPNGLVSTVTPTTKADPALERAAIEALKQWRFNPLESDAVMEGVIPLTFILR